MNGENGSRIDAQTTRMKQEYDRRLLQYEKDFDISLSRIASREKTLRESMLAYSERMRNISNARVVSENFKANEGEHLVIRAKHIPKHRQLPKKRRPLSLDELIGVNNKQDNKAKQKPKSASRLSLPNLPDRLTKSRHSVKVSFVSASDLYDIVDYSLKSKAKRRITSPVHHKSDPTENKYSNDTKTDTESDIPKEESTAKERKISMLPPLETKLRTESQEKEETNENKMKKSKTLKFDESPEIIGFDGNKSQLIKTEQKKETTSSVVNHSSKLVSNNSLKNTYMATCVDDTVKPDKPDVLKKRPNRAKRMKLHEPELGAIPEGDVLHSQSKRRGREKRDEKNRPDKTVIVRRSLGKVAAKPDLEIILETELPSPIKNDLIDSECKDFNEKSVISNTSGSPDIKKTSVVGNDAENYTQSEENSAHKLGPLKTKTKAQKRFKKLIFLRDIPEWYYQRM